MRIEMEDVLILAIESSCDETAAAVVKNGREVLSNVISSQIVIHTLYGGVVPEIASRKHIEKINQVIEEALQEAHVTLDDITAIAVTYGPGLVGALLVGVSAAKAISFATYLQVRHPLFDQNFYLIPHNLAYLHRRMFFSIQNMSYLPEPDKSYLHHFWLLSYCLLYHLQNTALYMTDNVDALVVLLLLLHTVP